MISAFWVLLNFKESHSYHTSGDFPIKITFFSQDDIYEVIYVGAGKETLLNQVLQNLPPHGAKRLLILEKQDQASKLSIKEVTATVL